MSIALLKEQLADVPGIGSLIMRYEEGGKVQVFEFGGRKVALPGEMMTPQIAVELRKAASNG